MNDARTVGDRPRLSRSGKPVREKPWALLKYFTFHPCVYSRFIAEVSQGAKRGDLLRVYDKEGQPFGHGFYNPGANVPLRMMRHGPDELPADYFPTRLKQAAAFRRDILKLDGDSDAYRVIHSDGDGLSGLVADRYADVLRVEAHSYGVWLRLPEWLPALHDALGTKRQIIAVDPEIAKMESIPAAAGQNADSIRSVRIRENGVRYAVNFAEGHKTGFFCDQRENRKWFAALAKGRNVLDLCCYTGGFALSAKLGGAEEVTGVDLDEKAIEQARQNANLNQARISWVHTDAFQYARQMQQQGRQWGAVVLDPPKLAFGKDPDDPGWRKYEDLNRVAIRLVENGGLFVTCSCSGLVSADAFEHLVLKAAHREGRRLQIFNRTVAGPDHPVMSNCLESQYLKVFWARVWQPPQLANSR